MRGLAAHVVNRSKEGLTPDVEHTDATTLLERLRHEMADGQTSTPVQLHTMTASAFSNWKTVLRPAKLSAG